MSTSGPVYGAGTTKRPRRTQAQVRRLQEQILAVLESDHPQSVRHVFYRLTDPRLSEPVDKSELGYRQVQQRLVQMRREGLVPYGWIADATRRGHHTQTFSSASDFVRRMHGLYRHDAWSEVDVLVEVWCESRSLAGVLQATCRELAVSLYPTGGFSSLTFVHDAVEHWHAEDRERVEILFVGDHDPAGVLIDQRLEAEMRQHFRGELGFDRLAINEGQISLYGLPTKPRKPSERRRPDIRETVEAEAMPAHLLRKIVRDAVEVYLPAQALQVARVAETAERHTLLQLAEAARAADQEDSRP